MTSTPNTAQDFPLAPLNRWTQAGLWVPLASTLMILLVTVLLVPGETSAQPLLWAIPLLVVIGLVLAMSLRRRRIAIEGRELVVAASFYTRRIHLDALDLAKARIVDLDEHTELRPILKTNGYGLPGFRAGHYRLRNLGKAFCLITDLNRALMLPQRDGKLTWLLKPEKPQILLERLRELAAIPPRR